MRRNILTSYSLLKNTFYIIACLIFSHIPNHNNNKDTSNDTQRGARADRQLSLSLEKTNP